MVQRKAYVSGTVVLLAALLAACTGGSGGGATTDDSNPGDAGTATVAAQPGKYRTLPEACGAVPHSTLDALLPGIPQIADPEQQDKAYQGVATLTYDTDRKVGCRWKVEDADATDHLQVDFERVVSYDNAVSDDSEAQQLFATRRTAAHLPEPSATAPASTSPSGLPGGPPSSSPSASSPASSSSSPAASADTATPDLQPRALSGLGDEAFLDDQLGGSGSTAQQRTVTVVFRTSNVIVTLEYAEQPTTVGLVPESAELQDRAQNLAAQLADSLGG